MLLANKAILKLHLFRYEVQTFFVCWNRLTANITSSMAMKGVCLYTSPEIAPTTTHQSSPREPHGYPITKQICGQTHPVGGVETVGESLAEPSDLSARRWWRHSTCFACFEMGSLQRFSAAERPLKTNKLFPYVRAWRHGGKLPFPVFPAGFDSSVWEGYGCYSHVQYIPGATECPWHGIPVRTTIFGGVLATGRYCLKHPLQTYE